MKWLGWFLLLLTASSPAWAAKKTTVQQLKDLLISLQQAKKSDAEVASALEQIELTEELTRSTMNSLVEYVPGPLATEQIYVLEARSATLVPPPADLPSTPPPDAAAQKAILDKAIDYAASTYSKLPQLTATKTTIRFQDNVQVLAETSGMGTFASDSDPNLVNPSQFVRHINSTEIPVTFQNGAEQNPLLSDKTTRWGANGQIALLGQEPVLNVVIQEAQAAGKINWLRWESVNGKTAAVYSFSVDRKKSHYAVNYCCFPDTEQAGVLRFTPMTAGGSKQATGNMQTNTSYSKNFKATVPYHGEIFVDPDTGIVVRLITTAEFKSSDLVQQEEQRFDYGPVTVGAKTLVLPTKTVIKTEIVPNGDTGSGKFLLRHTLFTAEYKNYNAAN